MACWTIRTEVNGKSALATQVFNERAAQSQLMIALTESDIGTLVTYQVDGISQFKVEVKSIG